MHRVSDRGRVRQLCRGVRVHGWGRHSGADEGRNIRVRLLQWLRGSLVLSSGLAAGMGFKQILGRQSYYPVLAKLLPGYIKYTDRYKNMRPTVGTLSEEAPAI